MAKNLYNGIIAPALLEWDRTSYPYAHIQSTPNKAYATSAPLFGKVEAGFFTKVTATIEAPFLCSTLKTDENNREYWTEWEIVTESTEIQIYESEWSNHDILKADGGIFTSASDPVPVDLPIVVFDGEAETKQTISVGFPSATLKVADRLAIGDKVRITLDGVSAEYEVKKVPTSHQSLVGNAGLNGNDPDAEDDGGDWLIAAVSFEGMSYRRIYFYTRTAGTYQLKIELLADEPETAPHDFYIVKNGVGQKQDVYLRVGDKCVKQEEYLS